MRLRFIANPRLYCLLPALFLFAYNPSHAQNSEVRVRQASDPQWVKPFNYETGTRPDEKSIEGGEYLLLFDQQYNLEQEAVYYRVVRQITSEAGVQSSSQITVTFSPSYQQLVFHTIRVLREGKVIDQLNLSKIKLLRNETNLERFVYSGLYTAYLNLEDVRPGDKVEYAYTVRGMNPVLDHHFGDLLYFNTQTPISHLLIRMIAAPDHPLYLKYFNNAPKPRELLSEGRKVYEWEMENRPAYPAETNEPAWYYGGSYIQVTTDAHWSDVARWAVETLRKAEKGNSTLISDLASQWNKIAGDSDLYYVKLATRFVQDQIRYMGVEMGPYSHLPHNPANVLKQRFGDCKDKSLLLYTFLHLRHIEASVAFVNAYYGNHLTDYLPSAALFDHAIITFTHRGNRYWIDPTIAYQRGNISNMATPDYGHALLVRPEEDSLTKMQVNDPGNIQVLERFTLPEETNGKGVLAVKTVYTGAAADDIRQQFKMNSFATEQKAYLNYYNQLYNHVSIVDSIQFDDEEENDCVTIREKYVLGHAWDLVDSSRRIKRFTVYAKSLQDRLPAAGGDNRTAPLAIMAPVNLTYRIQVIPPGVWNIQPSDQILSRHPYYYSFASSQSGDTINLDYIYQTYRDYIAADSVKLIDTDLQTINADLTYSLTQNESLIHSRSKLSLLSVWIVLISLVLFSWLAVRMYRYSPEKLRHELADGRPIGGWLILVLVGLCITPLRLIYNFITTGYFSQSLWLGVQTYQEPALIFWVALELIINTLLIVASIFILVLFFKRRNTLPLAFVFVYAFNIVFLFTDHLIYRQLIGHAGPLIETGTSRLIAYCCIWIPYFLISKRVKHTFVYAYGQKSPVILPQHPDPEPVVNHEPEISNNEDTGIEMKP